MQNHRIVRAWNEEPLEAIWSKPQAKHRHTEQVAQDHVEAAFEECE